VKAIIDRRRFLTASAASAAGMLAATPIFGAAAPEVTTLIVGFAPGGAIDGIARSLRHRCGCRSATP
jgi:tripartite-type tricarboxylate transporter receptor subunit TctC